MEFLLGGGLPGGIIIGGLLRLGQAILDQYQEKKQSQLELEGKKLELEGKKLELEGKKLELDQEYKLKVRELEHCSKCKTEKTQTEQNTEQASSSPDAEQTPSDTTPKRSQPK